MLDLTTLLSSISNSPRLITNRTMKKNKEVVAWHSKLKIKLGLIVDLSFVKILRGKNDVNKIMIEDGHKFLLKIKC